MFSNSELLEILNRENASRRKMEELNAQPPKRRPHRERQSIQAFQQWRASKLSAQRMAMSSGQAAVKTAWITGKGHYSAAPLGALKPILLAEMQVPAVHHGRVLACRAVTEPLLVLGNEVMVEDPAGDIESAIFYNFHSDLHNGGGWLKPGAIMLIKEPWLRYNHQAYRGETEKVMLRVDSPSDVIFVHETNRDLLSRMGALCWCEEERLTFDALKAEGNNAFGKGDFDAASTFYDRAMCLASLADETNVIHLNLAATKLSLHHYYDAYSHAETALAGGANREKALFRLGRSAYGMREWQRAVEHFETMLAEFPDHAKGKAELERAKARVLETTSGRYDLHKLSDESSGGRMPLFDVADYVGPVEVSVIPGKGKGIIATADLKAGTLLMVSKAYAMSVLKEARDTNLICINFLAMGNNSQRAILDCSTSALCAIDVAQKLKEQPQTASALYALYAGDEGRQRGESVKLPERVIDTGRIERICSFNAFGSQTLSKSSNEQTDVLGRTKEDAALWLMPSFLNHSCLGNSYRTFYGDVMFVYALCDVKNGEELTHSYCNPTERLRERELKLQKWHFQCDCHLCKLDRDDVEGEKKRAELMDEYQQMETLMLRGRLPPFLALPMAKAVVEEMRLSYSGRTSLHTQLPFLLEMLAVVYNQLGQHKKQLETMKAMMDCVGDSVLKFRWAPYPHLHYAKALLHTMNNARAAKRVAKKAFELVKTRSGVDKRLFLKKNPEFAEFIN